jgi:hypothetical protein
MRCSLIAFVATGLVSVTHCLPSSFLDEWNDEGTLDPFLYSNPTDERTYQGTLDPFLYSNPIDEGNHQGTLDPFLYSNPIDEGNHQGTLDLSLDSNPIDDFPPVELLSSTPTEGSIEELPFEPYSVVPLDWSEQPLDGFPEPYKTDLIATSKDETTFDGETSFNVILAS